jgi:quercetin dioxygenase-like cupin family protein
MTGTTVSRRHFNHASLVSLAAAFAMMTEHSSALAQGAGAAASTRRDVIKQKLPGDTPREITLLEVKYAPGAGSPAHSHAHGVMAYVVSGSIVSQVNDGPEQTFHAGDAWWEPPGAIHRVSRNASASEPATLLAIYIAPPGAPGTELMRPM